MEYKKVFAAVGITVAAALSVIIGYSLFGGRLEDSLPVISPLSSEQAGGMENTEEARAEGSELREDTAAETAAETSESAEPDTKKEIVFPLDINTATADELNQIDLIGAVTAQNIVSYRESNGYFYSLDELLNVSGIGEKKLEKIKFFIFISETLEEKPAAAETSVPVTEAETVTTAVTAVREAEKAADVTASETSVDGDADDYYEDDNELIEECYDENGKNETSAKITEASSETAGSSETEYCPVFPLELNSATARDLTYISGIGETLAQRIVEYAQAKGFYEVEDLLKVSGINESKLRKIALYVYADSSGLPPRIEYTESTFTEYDPFEPYPFCTDNNYTETAAQIYRINVNTADKADFMQLPGIDETLADNLIRLREEICGFEKIEELIFAEGMTTEKLAEIWDYVYI